MHWRKPLDACSCAPRKPGILNKKIFPVGCVSGHERSFQGGSFVGQEYKFIQCVARCIPDWGTGSGCVKVRVVQGCIHFPQKLATLNSQQRLIDADHRWIQAHIVLRC